MVPFSLGFLVPRIAVEGVGVSAAGALSGGLLLLALGLLLRRSTRATGFALAAGALLFMMRGHETGAGDDWGPAPRPMPIAVEGIVDGPCLSVADRCIVPLRGAPDLVIAEAIAGPLPGTRLRAFGALDARGRSISVADAGLVEVVAGPGPWHLGAYVEKLRRAIRERLETGLSPAAATHLKTLFLGDRGLSAEEREKMARTGTLHLFAVSGMHLVLLLGAFRRVLGPRTRLLLPLLAAYAALSGFASPVGRALLLTSGSLLARTLGRSQRPGRHFLFTLALVLAWDPRTLQQPGFQLSFAAYAGIIFLAAPAIRRAASDPFERILLASARERILAKLKAPLVVSLGAWAASLMPSVLCFHRISLAAIPGTLLLTPVVDALLVLSILLVIAPGFPPFAFLAETGIALLDGTVGLLDAIPFASLDVARPGLFIVACYTASLVVLAVRLALDGRASVVPWVSVACFLLCFIPSRPGEGLRLLDGGRGAALLHVGNDTTALFDCGPKSAHVADQVLALGVRRAPSLVLTHLHEDHAGGAPEAIQRLGVDRVFAPPKAGVPRARTIPLVRGDTPMAGIHVLWPPAELPPAGTNDRSLALRFRSGDDAVLILGDLETAGLRGLLLAGPIPPADTLVLPHHGAKNSALADLLLTASPDRALLPARPGFPDERTMLLLAVLGVPVEPSFVRRRGVEPTDRR